MALSNWFPLPINRRDALRAGGMSAGVAALSPFRAQAMAARGLERKDVSITEATNITVSPSPNGDLIAFDLLGLLWLAPIDGGGARCLTDAFADIAYPCWSPDGERIAFQSYQSGNFHIWTIKADGTDPRQLTSGWADHREPIYTSDGRAILFSSDRGGRYAIHKLDLASGAITQISHGESQDSEPCMAPDGRRIAYVADGVNLMMIEGQGPAHIVASARKPLNWTRPSGLFAPSFAPDGRLAYVTIIDDAANLHLGDEIAATGEDIYPFRAGWGRNGELYYASSGKIRRLNIGGGAQEISFAANVPVAKSSYAKRHRNFTDKGRRRIKGVASPMLSPDGEKIAFGALNDIYVLTLGESAPRRITDGPYAKHHPSWSPEGDLLAYATDRGGTMDLWVHELATGEERQLTHLPMAAAQFPCWSPDGSHIAFLNQFGALHIVEVSTGNVQEVYPAIWLPGRPSFSPDGKKIALAAFKPASGRFREGLSEILVIDIATGKGVYTPIRAEKSIATRGDDGPVWSPDGKYFAYVFASTLWVQPVTPDGVFNGAAKQISNEVTDAPSWSGDSQTLLYLSNGKLRLASLKDGKTRTASMRLRWRTAKAPELSIIRGARIWDGLNPAYREGDVIIRGNRIAGIEPPGSINTDNAGLIDGDGLTLMPGLIDMHTHRQVHGSGYGDRMGRALLAMGVTATRSPGGAAYHTTEDKEAIDAGLRIAPRHFSTGEALDGGRVYYNFMRPVTEPGQLKLELSRARALEYDMIKTYVRMDHRTQAEVIDAAHAMGLPVSSHYHYPALRHGADGVEHLGATSRFGFSRTITRLGAAYDDVNKIFAAAKAGRTPTLFTANALLPDYPELVSDPRIRALLPPWDLERLDAMAKMIGEGDRGPLLNSLENNVAQIKAMMAEGWHIHTGTDAPIDTIGVSYHLNLRAMTRFGVSNFEALLTATRHAGAYLGEPLGTIAPGQLADLILVEGDPLADIADVANVKVVIRDGSAMDVSALIAPFKTAQNDIAPSRSRRFARRKSDEYFWHSASYLAACRISCCDHNHVTIS